MDADASSTCTNWSTWQKFIDLRTYTPNTCRKRKQFYILYCNENTLYLRGEYTGDLNIQSSQPSMTPGRDFRFNYCSPNNLMVPCGVILFSLYSSIWCARSPILEKSFNFQIITADENFEKSKCLSCEHKITSPTHPAAVRLRHLL